MLSSLFDMAPRKQDPEGAGTGGDSELRKTRPDGETQYIDENDRLAIIDRMRAMIPEKTKAELARDCKVTAAAITLLISKPIAKGKTRGCKFMPALQKALGIVITDRTPAVVDRAAHRSAMKILSKLAPEDIETWLRVGESMSKSKR